MMLSCNCTLPLTACPTCSRYKEIFGNQYKDYAVLWDCPEEKQLPLPLDWGKDETNAQ